MNHLFSQVLNMSMTGSIVILLVIFVRLLLKRSPKIFSYVLWSVVLFRLLCPATFTAPVSVLNAFQPEMKEVSERTSVVTFIPAEINRIYEPAFVPAQSQSEAQAEQPEARTHAGLNQVSVASYVWLCVTSVMILYSIIQYIRLRKKLAAAMLCSDNVYLADYIDTAFVADILKPKIYLPSSVPKEERKYVIAHERHHIRRCDHIIKLLAYLALCIHWFNPLVWTAFILAGKDMEMSCDEAVIQKMGPEVRADYSASLLRLTTHKKIIAGMPLAFGEGDTKGRVMNLAKWKTPRIWVSVICMVLCAAVLAACAVNPEKIGQIGDHNPDGPTSTFTTSQNNSSELDTPRMDGPVSAGLEDFMFTLPEGMAMQSSEIAHTGNAWDYGYALYIGETAVGGVALRYQEQPNDPDSFSREWQMKIGVPEATDATMEYIGSGSDYADYECSYFPDVPVSRDSSGSIIPDEQGAYVLEHEVTHYFFVSGTDVYDLWFHISRLPRTLRETLLKSCCIESTVDIAAAQEALNAEADALEQCRNALAQIQRSGAYQIETRQENGPFALNKTALSTSWGYEDNRLHICIIPESGGSSSVRGLLFDGRMFECGTSLEWREITGWTWQDPWITGFQWDDSAVAYMGTQEGETGTTVMLRIDQPYSKGEDQQPHYFVNFNFDPDGAFRNVYIQTNLFMNNSISKTESILSLDPDVVKADIQDAYQQAVQ